MGKRHKPEQITPHQPLTPRGTPDRVWAYSICSVVLIPAAFLVRRSSPASQLERRRRGLAAVLNWSFSVLSARKGHATVLPSAAPRR